MMSSISYTGRKTSAASAKANGLGDLLSVFKGRQGGMNFLVVLLWAAYPLSLVFSFVFSRFPVLRDIKEFAFPIFAVICVLINLRGFLKGNIVKVLVFYLVTALIIAFSDIYAPISNLRYIEEYLPAFFFTTLPFVFIGNEYRDERVFDAIYLASVLAVFVIFAYHFVINPLSEVLFDEDVQESQGYAYALLPYLMIILWKLLERFNIFRLAFTVLSFVMLLLLGARGPILGPISFLALYLVICKKLYKKIGWLLVVVGAFMLVLVYLEQILDFLLEFAGDIGYSTRIFEMFAEGEISSEHGRDFVVDHILRALENRPFGLGLCGAEAATSGFYAHNLFLELVATFGWGIGGIFCVSFVFFIVKGFLSCMNDTQRGFYLVLFCTSFIPLMVSGIFLREPLLFLFIGYNIFLIDNKKRVGNVMAHKHISESQL